MIFTTFCDLLQPTAFYIFFFQDASERRAKHPIILSAAILRTCHGTPRVFVASCVRMCSAPPLPCLIMATRIARKIRDSTWR